MNVLRFSFLALALLFWTEPLRAAEAVNHLSEAETQAGWKLLFDGKTTAGWVELGRQPEGLTGWKVVDGELQHVQGGRDLVSAEAYDSFELTWAWKISRGGNSGVKYNLPDSTLPIGFEYQIIDDERHPDAQRGVTHRTAALYDLIAAPADRKLQPAGEWNASRLLVDGRHVEHWLNGAKMLEFEIDSPELKALIAASKYKGVPGFGEKMASPILLQNHGDAVAFRSIKLRALPAK